MKKDIAARVDDHFEFDINADALNGLDIVSMGNGHFHILKGQRSFKAEVISTDFDKKSFLIKVNGTEHQVQLADQYDQLIRKMGLNVSSASKMNDLKAPMPGLVLDILVKEGDAFEKGTPLLILEAMKMENIIKATGDGVVKSIGVSKSDAVEKGQILLELE